MVVDGAVVELVWDGVVAAAAVAEALPAFVVPQPAAAIPTAASQMEQTMPVRCNMALRIGPRTCKTLEIALQRWFHHL